MSKQNQTEKQPPQKDGRDHSRKDYAKYSGLAFQLAASIAVGVFIGRYFDEKYQTEKPYWTAGMSLLFLLVTMYSALKDIISPPKK